ncbi:DUF494 family protein [Candidatus Symbiobacter mobilis]|uniref:Uncharacterized protein n=1 Tax=Candidatus Symbiobacter mobilis CR TaxID=946483 RepID=U5N915_9BURK|nr:DUF494 family protein [Candidatus Symbiobacter mobilis]AGX87857.1 hypothetical protein Cenrod_1773 [Candidatus Symbiobacter mobilis CR]
MFDVLAFVFAGGGVPPLPQWPLLRRRLYAQGFAPRAIDRALAWLVELLPDPMDAIHATALTSATPNTPQDDPAPCAPTSIRVLSAWEQQRLGSENWGYLCHLHATGVLSQQCLHLVLDRATAASPIPLRKEDLLLVVAMVLWSRRAPAVAPRDARWVAGGMGWH